MLSCPKTSEAAMLRSAGLGPSSMQVSLVRLDKYEEVNRIMCGPRSIKQMDKYEGEPGHVRASVHQADG